MAENPHKTSLFFIIYNIYSILSVFCSGEKIGYGWLSVFFLTLAERVKRSAKNVISAHTP
jgi:hypothetical protein